MNAPPRLPAFDPSARPQKLRCEGREVFGWHYPDGTLELICRCQFCRKAGFETRHLWNLRTGATWTIRVPRHQPDGRGGRQPEAQTTRRELRRS